MKKTLALLLCACTLTLTACSGGNGTTASTSSENQQDTSSSAISTSTSQPTSDAAPDNRGIPGSDYFAVTYVLYDEFGISPGTLESSSTPELCSYSVNSIYEDQEQSATFDYSIALDNEEEVISATFGVTNYYSDTDTFLNRAELYIYAVGLLPYDTAQAETTAEDLSSAIDTLEDGTPFVITEGDAKFELYATKDASGGYSSIFVQISKAE